MEDDLPPEAAAVAGDPEGRQTERQAALSGEAREKREASEKRVLIDHHDHQKKNSISRSCDSDSLLSTLASLASPFQRNQRLSRVGARVARSLTQSGAKTSVARPLNP